MKVLFLIKICFGVFIDRKTTGLDGKWGNERGNDMQQGATVDQGAPEVWGLKEVGFYQSGNA